MPNSLETLLNLTVALGVGLLIGTERGWSARNTDDSHLAAGIRTFGLTGLLGGLATLFGEQLGLAAWVALLLVFGLLLVAGYIGDLYRTGEQGMTSEIAMLLTFLLGSLAPTKEYQVLAAAGAVIVTLLLSLKAVLHNMLLRLTADELFGALKLLFISVVLLPVLPNQGYGPWQAFNPYEIWWMVVLIAAIGFVAYVATRLIGTRYGLVLSALLGGIVSSTAMTLTLSRLHRDTRLHRLLACGLLATSTLMFPRILLEVGLINPALLSSLAWPMGVAALVYASGALLYYRSSGGEAVEKSEPPLRNPCELGPALRFAALLGLIFVLVEASQRWLGNTGVYLVALLAGLSDVDAITLSLARNTQGGLAEQVAAQGIFLAALSNSVVKAALISVIGGPRLARLTLPVITAGLLGGLAALWLL